MYYIEENRGKIQFLDCARQTILFDGLVTPGKGSPTDIDGLIEWHDRGYLIFEAKFGGAEIPYGQRLALSRMADALSWAGKDTVVVICEHHVADTNEPVVLAETFVRGYYHRGTWWHHLDGVKIGRFTQRFLSFLEKK